MLWVRLYPGQGNRNEPEPILHLCMEWVHQNLGMTWAVQTPWRTIGDLGGKLFPSEPLGNRETFREIGEKELWF